MPTLEVSPTVRIEAVVAVLLVVCAFALLAVGCALWAVQATSVAREEQRLALVDPFRVLELEHRLAIAADRIRAIEADTAMFARAHHLRAALWAYDALLREACELEGAEERTDDEPGISVTALQRALSAQDLPGELSGRSAQALGDPDARLRRELELGARGWTW